MTYNPGRELAAVEAKIAMRRALKRLAWSLAAGALTLAMLLELGPPQMLANAVRYGMSELNFQIGLLPLGKVTQNDRIELARAWVLVWQDLSVWRWISAASGAVSLISFGLSTYVDLRRGRRFKLDHIERGARLFSPVEHNRKMRQTYGRKPPVEMGQRLVLGTKKLLVPEALQYLHFAFAGASGSGKSTAIQELIEQAIARGDKGLVVDLGGAFYAKFGRPEDHVLSLRDPRSEAWDFWSEEGIPEEAFAAAMIESEGTSNPYFWKGARAVLASLLRTNHSVAELLLDFTKPLADIREKLAKHGELSLRIIGEGDGDQADGIIGTTVLDFAFLRELNQHAKPGQRPFSIARWMNDHSDHSWTYILFTEADLEVSRPLVRAWFDIACLAALMRDPTDQAMRHTWLILDEAKTVGRLPSLPHILDKGRKFRTSVVLGFQAVSQLETVYGKAEAKSILQGLQNQVIFRMSEATSAEYASEYLGDQEVEQASIGQSFNDKSERGSVNHSLVKKRLVMAEEVRELASLEAFMRLSRHAPVRATFAIKSRQNKQSLAVSKSKVKPISVPPELAKETSQEPEFKSVMPFVPEGEMP